MILASVRARTGKEKGKQDKDCSSGHGSISLNNKYSLPKSFRKQLQREAKHHEPIEDIWPDYPTKDDFFFNRVNTRGEGDLPDASPTQVVNKKTSFVEYAKRVNDLNYNKKEYGYSLWYNKQKLIEQFETFLVHWRKTPKFALKDLRPDVFDEYVQYRFSVRKNTSKEAVNKSLVPLYVAIKTAITNGILEQGTYG